MHTPRMSMDMLDSEYGCYEVRYKERDAKRNQLKSNIMTFMKNNGLIDEQEDQDIIKNLT